MKVKMENYWRANKDRYLQAYEMVKTAFMCVSVYVIYLATIGVVLLMYWKEMLASM